MSLINQVLRDLDAREAAEAGRRELADRVRPLPAERRFAWHPVVLALGSCALGVVIAWKFLPQGTSHVAVGQSSPMSSAPADVAAVPRVPVVASATVLAPPVARSEQAVPAADPAIAPLRAAVRVSERTKSAETAEKKPDTKNPVSEPALRLDRKLPEAAAATVGSQTASSAVPSPARSAVAAMPTPRLGEFQSAEPAQLEKRPRGPTISEAADAEYRKALNAFRRGATQEAVSGLRSTLLLDARHAQARQALLSLLVEGQNWMEAMAAAEEGLRIDPAQNGWAMALARLQVDHRTLAEALETLARYVRHAEQNADYIGLQAVLMQRAGRSHEAVERYHAALALRPAESRWWFGLGNALESDKRPQEAREAYLKARDLGNLPQELAGALEQRLR